MWLELMVFTILLLLVVCAMLLVSINETTNRLLSSHVLNSSRLRDTIRENAIPDERREEE